jgi:hypothetical protein
MSKSGPRADQLARVDPGTHQTIPLRFGDMAADVDERLAPIVFELWRRGVRTTSSCQDYSQKDLEGAPDEGHAGIAFESAEDADAFLDLLRDRHGLLAFGPLEYESWIDGPSVELLYQSDVRIDSLPRPERGDVDVDDDDDDDVAHFVMFPSSLIGEISEWLTSRSRR